MDKDFVLSEKKVEMFASKENSVVKGFDAFFEEDVKEFIKRLKEELSIDKLDCFVGEISNHTTDWWIDKLSGDLK